MTTDFYTTRTMPNGTIWYYKNGKLHRDDGPAVEYHNGDKEWWVDGKLHREGGPACEYANGYKQWWINNKLHREDGPAIELEDGGKEWWRNGERIDVSIYIPLTAEDTEDEVIYKMYFVYMKIR